MYGIGTEIVIVILLLLLNGVFAMSEIALVAARKTRLEHRAEDGNAGARAALALASNPTNFLATVQVGITLVGVLAGAFGGVGIAAQLAERFQTVPWLAPYAEPAALGVVVAAITYLSLIIGELVPKRIALRNPEAIAALVARPMGVIAKAGSPLVALLTGSTNLVFRMLGMRMTVDPGVTEQDIRAMVEQGAEAGVVQPAEHEIVENAFRLGDRQVGSIMTPRPDVHWLDVAGPPAETQEELVRIGAARVLVCEEEIDHVLGVVYAEDLLARSLAGAPLDLRATLHAPLFVPETMPVFRLLEEFRRSRMDVAVALDEFGGVQGVATLEDILEALVGDLPDAGDLEGPEIARHPDGSWLVDGAAALEDLEAQVDADPLPEEQRRGIRTVAGVVMAQLGRLPAVGDVASVGGVRYEVVAMEGRRVATLRVTMTADDDAA